MLKQTGSVGLALARICFSLGILNRNNFPTNGLILIQFTLEDSSPILLNNNNNDFISIALFHVKHAQLR